MSPEKSADTRNVALFGATGSIGRQALDVLDRLSGFRIAAMCAGKNWEELAKIAARYRPDAVAIADINHVAELKSALFGTGVKVLGGAEAAGEIAELADYDIALNGLVGVAGLLPSYQALKRGRTLALANKESLVLAGDLLKSVCRQTGAEIIPVDSEHSAIFQCLIGESLSSVRRLVLTASGGPFRDWSLEKIGLATPAEALNHPTWRMGPKITVDSATLMNKGLEVIEACHLFDLTPDRVDVRLHPVSVVHSMVEFNDGTYKAHLGKPDMRLPIQFALTWPERMPYQTECNDPSDWPPLTFAPVPLEKFPCLELARRAFQMGGTAAAALNGADEAAVELFLKGEIKFTDIAQLIQAALDHHVLSPADGLEQVLRADGEAREFVRAQVHSRPNP